MTKADLKVLARQLRRRGRTYDEIARELGVAKSTCSVWLRDLPHPEPGALPALPLPDGPLLSGPQRRARARQMRAAGALLREVAAELDVTVSTASAWCAGLPAPGRARHGGDAEHARRMAEARWAPYRAQRDARRHRVHEEAAAELGPVTPRDLLLALAVSYWCEGGKAKRGTRARGSARRTAIPAW